MHYPPRNNQIHIQELPRQPRHEPQPQLALLGPPPRGQPDLGAQKHRNPRESAQTHLVENSYDHSYNQDTTLPSVSSQQYQTDNSCSWKRDEYSTPPENPAQLAIQDGYAIATGPMSNRCFICGETGHSWPTVKLKTNIMQNVQTVFANTASKIALNNLTGSFQHVISHPNLFEFSLEHNANNKNSSKIMSNQLTRREAT
ncbi:hypothetical protein O6H91_06G123200 [Diphasiastrum complanatum]|uniref:Uncharacterized protein n=1 Tax=Diphasiastrum complanatum TaxID=34168 RepID=A0ACC2DIL4_DIPCM|nr:hypothetical protein O6H91_06G123200 [Diphasiastrum complanatum]